MRGAILLAGMLLSCGSAAAADEQPICANRPGKSTPTCTVPAAHVQVETALADWSLQKAGSTRDSSVAVGETTFIYGLSDSSDIELDVTPWQRQASSAAGFHDRVSGFGDLVALFKQRLTRGDAAVQVAALPFVKLPTAKRPLGNGKVEGGLHVPIDYSVANTPVSIESTPEIDWAADATGHGHHFAMAQVVSLGLQATRRLSLSAELWEKWDWDPQGTSRQASADGTLAYLVKDTLQLDAGANFGLNRQTPDVELYAGVSARF